MTDTPVNPRDVPPVPASDVVKAFIGDLARPFAIISTSFAASWATIVISYKVENGSDGAPQMHPPSADPADHLVEAPSRREGRGPFETAIYSQRVRQLVSVTIRFHQLFGGIVISSVFQIRSLRSSG